eukprot:12677692-Alexandrium_andersonii.AAC.1
MPGATVLLEGPDPHPLQGAAEPPRVGVLEEVLRRERSPRHRRPGVLDEDMSPGAAAGGLAPGGSLRETVLVESLAFGQLVRS